MNEKQMQTTQNSDHSHSRDAASSLSLVQQEDDSGCGLACVAMLAKCTYAHARKIWLTHGGNEFAIEAVNSGTTWYQLCHLMEVMGVKIPQAWETPRIISIKGHPLLNNGHWVVVDGSGKIFDPANERNNHE